MVKNLPAYAGGARHSSLIPGLEDPLDKEMEIHTSILAWRIPWTEEPGRLQSMGDAKSRTRLTQFSNLSEGKTLRSHPVLTYGETSLSVFCQFSWIHCPYSLNIIIPLDMFPSGLIPMHLSGHGTLFPLKPSSLSEKTPGYKMLESTRPGFDPWLYCLTAVWPWTTCFVIPNFNFFSSNMSNKKLPNWLLSPCCGAE